MRADNLVLRRIKEEVAKKNWDQKDLAIALNMSEGWMSKVLKESGRGKINLQVEVLLNIADALGVDPRSLLIDGTEPKREGFKDYCRGIIKDILKEEGVIKIK